MRKNIRLLTVIFFSLLLLSACKNSGGDKDSISVTDTTSVKDTVVQEVRHKYEMVISDIPFPFEILDNLYQHHVNFNDRVMNTVNSIAKYDKYNFKALNLGVYGADLAYAVTYEQFQYIGSYIKATKKLAEDLNIPIAFDQPMLDKYNKFKENKDSLTQVVYDSYTKVDKALKNNERVGMAALVVTGSWLEGLYISTRTFLDAPKSGDNKALYKTIRDQKRSLAIVIRLLDEYKTDPFFAALIKDLSSITSEYDHLSNNDVMNEEQLISINKRVEALRNRITEGL